MPQKPRTTGWDSRCGQTFRTEVLFKAHRKECQACKDIRATARVESAKQWHVQNPEKSKALLQQAHAAQKIWKEQNPELMMVGIRKWEVEKRDEFLERQKKASQAMLKWQKRHPAMVQWHAMKLTAAAKKWRLEHPEEFRDNYTQLSILGQEWRETHPEEFGNIARKFIAAGQTSASSHSYIEEELKGQLGWTSGLIQCGDIVKQVDLVHENIWIEVDGFWHFFSGSEKESAVKNLQYRQHRDMLLNQEALRRGDITLIRLSMENFSSRTKKMKEGAMIWLTRILQSPTPGIWCVGALYDGVPWANDKCTILKLPT